MSRESSGETGGRLLGNAKYESCRGFAAEYHRCSSGLQQPAGNGQLRLVQGRDDQITSLNGGWDVSLNVRTEF